MTGRVSAYFYPHIRDRLYRHSIIMVPDQIALASHSMAGRRSSYATMLTTDSRLVQARSRVSRLLIPVPSYAEHLF